MSFAFPRLTSLFLGSSMLLLGLAGCSHRLTLRQAAGDTFLIGTAVNNDIVTGADAETADLVGREFNTLTPENSMKWEKIQPEPGRFDFVYADKFVEFGERHRMTLIGHCLLWHQQTPAWVFTPSNPGADLKAEMRQRLIDHITTVVTRYRGKMKGWDVVNEAYDEKGNLRTDQPWYRVLGEDAIFLAFETAHKADPGAELYYNDYSFWETGRRAAVISLVKRLRERGLRIDAVGMQEHYMNTGPTFSEVEAVLKDFQANQISVMVTELDISLLPRPDNYGGAEISRRYIGSPEFNPYANGLPEEKQQELARLYAGFFSLYRKYASIVKRVTVWGVSDRNSWLNHWPIAGRTDYPLLFDRDLKPKPAHDAVVEVLKH